MGFVSTMMEEDITKEGTGTLNIQDQSQTFYNEEK
jgi:hypothetical protein